MENDDSLGLSGWVDLQTMTLLHPSRQEPGANRSEPG